MEITTIMGVWNGDDGETMPGELHIAVVSGLVLDVDPNGAPLDETGLRIDADGHIRGWGDGISFKPDEGEAEKFPGAAPAAPRLQRIDKLPRF